MAVRSITTRLALDGETQFKQAMSSINGALRSLKSELALSEAQFRGQANTVEALAAKDKILQQTLEQQRVKVQALAQALVDAKAVYGDNSAMVDRYQQQLNRAQVELIEMNRALEDNSRYLREAQESADRTTHSLDEFGNEADDAQDPVDALASALQAAGLTMGLKKISDMLRDCVAASMEFDAAMSDVAATMGVTVDDLGEMREFALEMGASTAFTATQSAQALNYMALAGYDAKTAMETLPNVLNLAAAGGLELASASDMITDAQSALGLSLEETTRLVDEMAKTSTKTNTSVGQLGEAILTVGGTAKFLSGGTQELNQILGLLADNSIKASEGGTKLRNIILSLSAPTEKAAAVLDDLGVSIFDAEGNMREFSQIFPEMQRALSKLTDQQQIEALGEIFNSRDIAAAQALLGTTIERWEELDVAIQGAAGSAQQMAETRLDNLAGDLTLFQSAVDGAKIAIGEALTPALRVLAKAGTEGFSWATEFIKQNPVMVQLLTGLLTGLGALAAGMSAVSIASAVTGGTVTTLTGAVKALSAAIVASPIAPFALAIGAGTAVFTAFAYAADEASSSARELTASMEESRKSMEEQQAASAAQRQDTEALTAQLEELAEKEHRTAAEKEQLLEITRQLNEAIPELGLSYDKLTDSLNMTTDQVLALARAQADAQERQELAQAIVQNEKDQAAAVQALKEAQDRLTAAIERRNAAIESGNYDSLGAEHAIELANGVSQAEKEVADLEEALAQSQAQAAEMKAKLDELTASSGETAGAMDELTGAAGGTDAEWGELIEAAEALEEATLYVTGAQDALTEALKEQKKNGSLSVATTKELIEAGYGAALAIDEETGAVLLDQEAYLALAQAKLQEKIAALETQRQSVQSAAQLHQEKAAADGAANSIWGVVHARLAETAANQTDDIDAQIAALRRAQEALKNYSFNADEAVRRSSAASRKIKTQAEEDLDTYKALKAELDHERAVGLADERSYYERMAEYRDQYLTDEANISEYRKVTEQIYKYDKSLAEREIDLWAEQSDALIDELEERMDSVTRQQDRMEDKLSDYGDLFKMEDGNLIVEDTQKGIDAINAYGDALERLRDRAPTDGLMQQVLGLDVDTATQYANQLLSMTDKEWNEYNAALDTKQKRAAEIAEQFFKDELDTLETKYNDKLKGSLGELKSTSFDSGVDTAQGLIDGLASKEDALYTQAQNMAARVSEILAGAGRIPSNSELAASFAPERFQEQYLGVTPRDMQNASAGVVNGVSAAMAGQGFDAPLNITIQTEDKTTIARAFVPSIRQASKEDPEVMDDR